VNVIISLSYPNKYILAKILKHFEAILNETFFIRIHKSYILNILNGKVLDFQANKNVVILMEEKNKISCRKIAAIFEEFAFYNKRKFDTH
jgi:DNA-binding LytR/AlgR family response regulator